MTPLENNKAELLALKLAVSDAIDTWAILENELAGLLQEIIDDEFGLVGTAIYYAPTNTETRIKIVDEALTAASMNRPFGEPVTICWKRIRDDIRDAKGTRNKIAHWYTTDVTVNGNGPFVRLTQPHGRRALPTSGKAPQLPGMSANDLRVYETSLRHILAPLRQLQLVVRAMMKLSSAIDEQLAFLQMFHQLADDLRLDGKSKGAFWPPRAPPTPPTKPMPA